MSDITFALEVHSVNHDDPRPKIIHENLKCPACGSTNFKSARVHSQQFYLVCAVCFNTNAAATILGASTKIQITHV